MKHLLSLFLTLFASVAMAFAPSQPPPIDIGDIGVEYAPNDEQQINLSFNFQADNISAPVVANSFNADMLLTVLEAGQCRYGFFVISLYRQNNSPIAANFLPLASARYPNSKARLSQTTNISEIV